MTKSVLTNNLVKLSDHVHATLPGLNMAELDSFISSVLESLAKLLKAEACILSSGTHFEKHGPFTWEYIRAGSSVAVDILTGHAERQKSESSSPIGCRLPSPMDIPIIGLDVCELHLPGLKGLELLFIVNSTEVKNLTLTDSAAVLLFIDSLLRVNDKKLYSLEAYLSNLFLDIALEQIDIYSDYPDKSIERILQKFLDCLGFERMTMLRPNQEEGKLYTVRSISVRNVSPYSPNMVSTTIFPELYQNKQIVFQDIEEESMSFSSEDRDFLEKLPLRTVVLTPIFAKRMLDHVLAMATTTRTTKLSKIQMTSLRSLAQVLGAVTERRQQNEILRNVYEKTLNLQGDTKNTCCPESCGPNVVWGQNPAMRELVANLESVSKTGATVLIYGESGTGKEVLASYVHEHSQRCSKRMVVVNCAAIPAGLFESELFGSMRGAYTSAYENRVGKLEAANGSTLFMDEIAELPLESQAKLLRVLQCGEFERLGSTRPIKADIRIVAATNKKLEDMVDAGLFRADLYYRLAVFPVTVVPLRERREDIPALTWHFLRQFEETYGKRIPKMPQKTLDELQRYSWPGNIRELRNVIERSVLLCKNGILDVSCAIPEERTVSRSVTETALDGVEREHIRGILIQCRGKLSGKGGAAEILQLDRSTLAHRLRKLRIDKYGQDL